MHIDESSRTLILALILIVFGAGYSFAHNIVVVVPLDDDTSIEPFAPVAAASSPNRVYTIGTDTVVDNVTGLEWQKTDDDTPRNWSIAKQYCYSLIEDGHYDWRLPTREELRSIVDYGTSSPAVNSVAFPDTDSSDYWSATSYDNGDNVWVVSFDNGNDSFPIKSSLNYVRCVRGFAHSHGLFVNNGNGTVTDLVTGLTWQQQDDDVPRPWATAISYCQNLTLAGRLDWRLPDIKELASIVYDLLVGPAIDNVAFPGTNSSEYWSATSYAVDNTNAWVVNFNNGADDTVNMSFGPYVRCVR